MSRGEIIDATFDPAFTDEVVRRIGLEKIRPCYTCGACTAVCPVRTLVEDFDPRQIIHWIVLGMRERVLRSDLIWLCCLCNTCYHVCPQGIRFSRLALELRGMAREEGFVEEAFEKRLSSIEGVLRELCRRTLFHKVREGFRGPHSMPCWRKETGNRTDG